MVTYSELDVTLIDVEQGLRHTIEKESLEELASSIKMNGILQPLVVEPVAGGRYNLQIGKRRMAAAKLLGLEVVPVLILDGQLESTDSLVMRLVENLQRKDLDPIDEAEAYAILRHKGVKMSVIARRVGKPRTYVSHSMRLLRLHPKVREAVRQRAIPREHAISLLRLDPEKQVSLAEEIMNNGLTTVKTRERVRSLLGKNLKWRLVPIRLDPAVYDRLVAIAPEGDVSTLLKQAVENLLS